MADINKNLPRDVFMYLLSVVTLVVSAIFFGMLLFQYINIYFPDIVNDYYFSPSNYFGAIRQALATLVVVFPVFFWVSWFLKKDIKEFPEKRELKIRKWLLYLTVFVAALVIIGDLVTLINTFLNGELTTRFVLKVISILFIAGSVFSYYFLELRTAKKESKPTRVLSWVVVAVVTIGVVAGFFVVGSPASQRLIRLDDRRVSDLQTLQSQIINYWQAKEKLPSDLSELKNDISGFVPPVDPQTGNSYEYKKVSESPITFELCAVFDLSAQAGTNGSSNNQAIPIAKPASVPAGYPEPINNWQHDQGRYCFNRTIDPQLYPPIGKPPLK